MNKKITKKVIRIIFIQSIIVIIAISMIGGAIAVHNQYKTGSYKKDEQSVKSSDTTTTEMITTTNQAVTNSAENNTTVSAENSDYEYGYAGFNPKTADTSVGIEKILVNKNNALPEGYTPTLATAANGYDIQLDYRVVPFYQAMYDAAKEDGITLTPVSGYRSYDRQKTNFENLIQENIDDGMTKKDATIEAAKTIMLPGASEHNAGLAMDICSLSESFENTDEFAWLSENAEDYGFILRYPKSEKAREITGVIYEPWHYRYVGVDAAKEINSKGITLEEYLGAA